MLYCDASCVLCIKTGPGFAMCVSFSQDYQWMVTRFGNPFCACTVWVFTDGHSLLIARNDRALKSKSCALYLSFLKLRVRVCTSLKQLFFSLSDNGGRQFMTISQCNCWFKFSGDTSNFEQFLRKIWVKSTYQACKQFQEKLIYNLSLDKVSQIYSDLCLLLKRIIG